MSWYVLSNSGEEGGRVMARERWDRALHIWRAADATRSVTEAFSADDAQRFLPAIPLVEAINRMKQSPSALSLGSKFFGN